MAEIPVLKHWIITAFTPGTAPDLSDSIGGAVATTVQIGTIGSTLMPATGSVTGNELYADSHSAMDAARTLAQLNPGTYYVVYEAMWWAHTDPVPVHLLPVIQAVTA